MPNGTVEVQETQTPPVSKKAEDITLRRPDISLGKVVIKRPVESQVISTLEQDATYNHTSFTAILASNIYHEDLDDWTYYKQFILVLMVWYFRTAQQGMLLVTLCQWDFCTEAG